MPASQSRRQLVALAGLALALVAVVAYQWRGGKTPASPQSTDAVRAASARGAAAGERIEPVPDVRLSELTAARPEPAGRGRNLFREQPKAPPPMPPRVVTPVAPPPLDPNAPPPPPPPPPPIPLKFIGVVQGQGGAIAVLSDGRDVFYGREGQVIEGRYKIIKIGVESIQMSYVDGRGTQFIRLTG
ncbi:MAG TPA: hypothetical protein VGK32_06625 [Vicinamibacterales bacterium]|jgi:hypothetical protein